MSDWTQPTFTFRDLTEKNRQLQQAYDDLKAAQAQLIEKERLERELQLAAEIQLSILPDELPQVNGFDFGACMLPARQVGGDFYDVFQISEGRDGVLIGDVSDKGVPAIIHGTYPRIDHGGSRPWAESSRSHDYNQPASHAPSEVNPVCYGSLWHPGY
jgi:hypothetical protein